MFSRTVFHGNNANCWNTTARSAPGPFTRRPPTRTIPEDGTSSPAAMRSSVVFPQPDGPTMARNCLSGISRLTSARAVNEEPPRGNTVVIASKTMSLMGSAPSVAECAFGKSQSEIDQ